MKIETENFQLIYPTNFGEDAQKMANVLESVISRVSNSLGKKPEKISIILQNQGTSSNGFVQLAPRRSEYFTTPSQSFDYQSWLNSLAVHELRHVVQFDKLTRKLNRFPFEALGLAIFGITLPSWFFEGDAVTAETALTKGGRGRIPEWYVALRANTLSGKKYSYSKNYFGSVKDFTAGYYQLGFFMNAKLRRDFGEDITNRLLSRISANPLRPYNFNNSLRKLTDFNSRKLHDSTVNELEDLWLEQLKMAKAENYISLNKRKNGTPENFLLPAISKTGSLIFLKRSLANAPAIIEQDKNGKIRKITDVGSQEIPWFSYGGDKIVWDEFRFDARFHQRSFNVINIYDFQTKSKRQLTNRSRLFAPSISADGLTIIAVEISLAGRISLVELDSKTGKEIKRYESPENFMLQMPSFNLAGDKIAVVVVGDLGKSIYELDRASGKFSQLMPFELQEILHPVYANDYLIFKAHFNGIDNLYKLSPATKKTEQLTSVKFGAANPFFDHTSSTIFFNNYTAKGYDISSIPFAVSADSSDSPFSIMPINYADPIFEQEGGRSVLENITNRQYPEKRFKELANLFYFHSIVPSSEDNPYSNENNIGLRLQSDNKLNTLSFNAGYQFNNALKKSEYHAGFSYQKFFPVLNVDYVNRPRFLNRRTLVNNRPVFTPVSWREDEIKANISIPVIGNRFNNIYRSYFKIGTSYTSRYQVVNDFPALIKTFKFPMHYEFSLSRNNTRSSRDLAPKWGQSISMRYRHFPFESKANGDLFTLQSAFYFPGLATNHSLQASFNFQHGSGNYENSVDIPRVSGYAFLTHSSRIENTLLLDYRLPLFYPDWELGSLAYIKRLKGGIFADFENINKTRRFSPRSYGLELRADMNLLRFMLPNFDLGGKLIFLNEKPNQKPIFETIVSYNF